MFFSNLKSPSNALKSTITKNDVSYNTLKSTNVTTFHLMYGSLTFLPLSLSDGTFFIYNPLPNNL
jgi:hypothetical protein